MPALKQSSRAGGVTTTLLVLASVGLNLFLAAQLFPRRASSPGPPVASGNQQVTGGSKLPTPVAATNSAVALPVAGAQPFHWSDIESTDYRQYIANLRAVGCPEPIIHDLILADVNQLFAARVQAVWQPPIKAYWQKPESRKPGRDERRQLAAIDREKGAVFQDLLGTKPSQQALLDTLNLQLNRSEQQLLFLPPEQRAAALRVLNDADYEARHLHFHILEGGEALFDEKLELLAGVLAPGELEEFKLRNSEAGDRLRQELEYFDATPEEFGKLFAARVAQTNDSSAYLNNSAATADVRRLFGEERAKEFERVSDPVYIELRRSADAQGVPREKIEQAWEVTREMRATAELVARNSSLSTDERERQVQALQQQANARMNALLGGKVARNGRLELDNVLGLPEWNRGP